MKIYKVGGSVRDNLLGIHSHEKDWVVVGANPEIMLNLGYIAVGNNFPVFLHPKTKEEYALARTEKKTGVGYKGFTFFADDSVTIEEDLQRRDLTINAIAEDQNGARIDPLNGSSDIKKKIFRNASSAFSEDPLRAFRVARLSTLEHLHDFKIAKSLITALNEIKLSGELANLSAERVWQETEKALLNPRSSNFFKFILKFGLTEPWFTALKAVPNIDNIKNPETKWITLQASNNFALGKGFLVAKNYKILETLAQKLIDLSKENNHEKIVNICKKLSFQRNELQINRLLEIKSLKINVNKVRKIKDSIAALDFTLLSSNTSRDVKLLKNEMILKTIKKCI